MAKGVGQPAPLLNQTIAKHVRCDGPEQRQTFALLVVMQAPCVVMGEKPYCCAALLLRKQKAKMGQMSRTLKSLLVSRDSKGS